MPSMARVSRVVEGTGTAEGARATEGVLKGVTLYLFEKPRPDVGMTRPPPLQTHPQ